MSDLIGQRLGQYEIMSVLGQGGMATVYRARQISVNREVAVKVIKKELDVGENFAARFSREAQTVAQLSHPHILKLFDYGQEGATIYLVAELLPGGTLQDLIKQGQRPLDQVDRLLSQIASALDYAHQQGVIHRDLKPQNVLLDSHGNAFLTDFGLARLVADATRLTQTGLAMGTPAYMSPEAWQGGDIDSRSDIYSLGVMLYEMLTGDLPFHSDSPYQLMFAHINEMPPHVNQLPIDFSPQIDQIVQQALAKSPADRPGSAMAMAFAFHAALSGDKTWTPSISVTPRPAPPDASATKKLPTLSVGAFNRRWLPIAAGIAALVLLIIAGIALLGRPTATPSATQAPTTGADVVQVAPVADDENMVLVAQPEQLGKQARSITRFIVDDLTDTLDTGIPFSKVRIREYPKVITTTEQAKTAAKANHAWVIVWGSVGDEAIDLQVQVGDLSVLPLNKIPEEVIRRYTDVHVRLTDPHVQSVAVPVLVVMDTLQAADGNAYESARIISLLDQLKSSTNIAEVIGNSGAARITRTELLFVSDTQKFVEQMQPIIDLDSSSPLPYMYRSLGYYRIQQFDRGLQDVETAKRLGPEGWITPLFMLAFKDFVDKNYDSAIKYFNQIIEINPKDWYIFTFRGTLYYLSGNLDAAKADVDAAIALNPNSNGPYGLGILLGIRQGRIGDAQSLIKVMQQKFPDASYMARMTEATLGDPSTSKVVLGLMLSASSNMFLAQYDRVLKDIDTALKIDSSFPDLYLTQGFAYCNLSKWKEAEEAYTNGLKLDPNFAVLYALRAEVRTRQGNVIGALSDIQAMQKVKGSEELTAMVKNATQGGVAVGCQNVFASRAATPAK